MAWEWSHTGEAYDNALTNLEAQPREFLEVCWAEIRAAGKKWTPGSGDGAPFYESVYKRAMQQSRKLPSDILAEAIWEFACEFRTCSNGGHDAYMCPYGCHTVEFSAPEESD